MIGKASFFIQLYYRVPGSDAQIVVPVDDDHFEMARRDPRMWIRTKYNCTDGDIDEFFDFNGGIRCQKIIDKTKLQCRCVTKRVRDFDLWIEGRKGLQLCFSHA